MMSWVQSFSGRYAALLVIMALIPQACADQNLPPINTGIQGNQYKSIAIRAVSYELDPAQFPTPVEGAAEGTSEGAKTATIGWLGGCTIGSGGILLLACLAVTPVATVTGSIVGAGSSHSADEVTRATTALKNALKEARPTKGLTQAVARNLVRLKPEGRVTRTLCASETHLTDTELSRLGFDAVLEVEVIVFDLAVYGTFDPEASVKMMVHGDLHETAGRSASMPLSWTYLGERHSYFEFAKGNAQLFHKALEQSYDETAKLIIDDLFFTPRPN